MRIVVTGGNGEFGRLVITQMEQTVPSDRIIATVRDPEVSNELASRGVSVRPGDFDQPDLLKDAFAGAEIALINATFFGAATELRGERVRNAITAAATAGVGRLVLTTWPDLDNCPLSVIDDYRQSEDAVRSAGPEWTILRMGYGIGDAVARDVLWGLRDREIVAPAGESTTTPAAVEDLAAAAAKTLTGSGHEQATYEITGPDAITWTDLAGLASRLADDEILYRPVTTAAYRDLLADKGFPPLAVDGLIDLYSAIESGWANTPTGTLRGLIEREPISGIDAVALRVERARQR